MESISRLILLFLGIVVFLNVREGTIGDWLRAKFLNAGEPDPQPTATNVSLLAPPTAGGGAGAGRFLRPMSGPTISVFGDPRDGGSRKHEGIDIGGPTGATVSAAAGGRVKFAGAAGNCGLMVTVDHGDGWTTRYCHLSRITTSVGTQVAAGEKLGENGDTGNAKGGPPHLHFEIRRNGKAVDPQPLLAPTGVVA